MVAPLSRSKLPRLIPVSLPARPPKPFPCRNTENYSSCPPASSVALSFFRQTDSRSVFVEQSGSARSACTRSRARCPITLLRRVSKSGSRIFLIIFAAHDTRHRGREMGATVALIGAARKSDSAYSAFSFLPHYYRGVTRKLCATGKISGRYK